jgi:DDE domain
MEKGWPRYHQMFFSGRSKRSQYLASGLSYQRNLDIPLPCGGLAIRNTLECLLSTARDAQAAKRFFVKALGASHTVTPRVITVDKNAAYPKA